MSQQQSQLSAYDEDEDVAEYRCPYCEFADERDWLVRVHIHRSDEEPHHHRDGFMPEDELKAISPAGEVLDTVPGNPTRRFELLQSLEPEDMPEGLSYPEQVIVLTAVQNLTENYSTVQERVNQRLRDEGLEPVDYNKAYRTAIQTLGVARKSKKMSQQQSQKTYEDLTDKQRAVINEYIRNPDQSMAELARNAGVDPSYPQQVIDKYGHIADGMTNADVVPVDSAEDAGDVEGDDDEDTTPSSRNDPTPTTQKEYDDLTELQREVLDALVEHPEKSHKDIAEDVGCDGTYPGKVEDKFEHIIRARRNEMTDAEGRVTISIDDEEYLVSDDLAEDFNDLTKKQQSVIHVLMDEDDPTDPDQNRDDIGQQAGVHGTYVQEVRKKYGDLATRLKQEAVPAEDVEDTPTTTEQPDTSEEPPESESESEPEPESEAESEPETSEEEEVVEESVEEDTEPEDQPFAEQFRAAVEDDDVSRIPVREISSGIGEIEDTDLLEQALERDSRKTSSREYESRLDELTEPEEEVESDSEEEEGVEEAETSETEEDSTSVEWVDEAEDEDEGATETDTEAVEDTSEPDEAPTESVQPETEPVAAQQGAIPVSELEEMRDRAEMLIRTAESELENSDQKAPAARAKSVAEEFQRMIDDALTQGESDQSQAQQAQSAD